MYHTPFKFFTPDVQRLTLSQLERFLVLSDDHLHPSKKPGPKDVFFYAVAALTHDRWELLPLLAARVVARADLKEGALVGVGTFMANWATDEDGDHKLQRLIRLDSSYPWQSFLSKTVEMRLSLATEKRETMERDEMMWMWGRHEALALGVTNYRRLLSKQPSTVQNAFRQRNVDIKTAESHLCSDQSNALSQQDSWLLAHRSLYFGQKYKMDKVLQKAVSIDTIYGVHCAIRDFFASDIEPERVQVVLGWADKDPSWKATVRDALAGINQQRSSPEFKTLLDRIKSCPKLGEFLAIPAQAAPALRASSFIAQA